MLRLASSRPPLWRTASSLQLGEAADAPRLDDIAPWQERVLTALASGIADGLLVPYAVQCGAPIAEAERFREQIAGALATDPGESVRARVEAPADLSTRELDAIVSGLQVGGVTVTAVTRWADDAAGGMPVILVSHRLVDPRRAARLVAADATHLPVELAGDGIGIGPLVVPGRSACLRCRHERRIDDDASWPLVAAQLLGREPVVTDPALLVEAALLAARLLRAGHAGLAATVSSGSVQRRWRAHRPHARCLCRSPEGIATADAHDDRSCEPTTATAFARLA
jgi:hypothetical protein